MRKKFLIAIAVVITPVAIAAVAWWTLPQQEKTFERTWFLVKHRFYDPDTNGFDWNAVHDTYLPKARSAKNQMALYWEVLNPMLSLLESSHAVAVQPTAPQFRSDGAPAMEVMEPQPLRCAGLAISTGELQVLSKVRSIDEHSILYQRGVRRMWRLGHFEFSGEAVGRSVEFHFLGTEGVEHKLAMSLADAGSSLEQELKNYARLLGGGADPNSRVQFASLGMELELGHLGTPPAVLRVYPDSIAARAGVEPGFGFRSLSLKHEGSGSLRLAAEFVAPNREVVSVDATYPYPCDMSDEQDRIKKSAALPGDVLYLRFDKFDEQSMEWIGQQLSRNPKAVVVDLRENSGGHARSMQQFVGYFLPKGTSVGTAGNASHPKVVPATASPAFYRGPLAVLIGPMSASSAEVSSNALQYYKRAKLYGENSLGQVLISQSFPLPDGGTLLLATSDFRGPDGLRLERRGVKVDREVRETLASVRSGHDVVVDAAVADLIQQLDHAQSVAAVSR